MNTSKFVIVAYLIYLPLAFALTVWSARMLFKNGIVFMRDIFHGNEALAQSTNKLFEVGYFLLNVGFALIILQVYDILNYRELIETLSTKIGSFTIYIGIVFMLNVVLFMKGRKHANRVKL